MGEGFKADPDHIAGYGVLVEKVAEQTGELSAFLQHAKAGEGFNGLMELIKEPVNLYAEAAIGRLTDRVDRLGSTSDELTRTAWAYSGADEDAYIELTTSAGGPEETVKEFPDPASYKVGEDATGELEAPEIEEADVRGLLDDVGGLINGIDDAVDFITGWSPVTALVEPMSGNWNAMSAAGEALAAAGDAAEQIASNLTKPLSDLDPHWNGGAALEFEDYIDKQAKAIAIEGPLNRIVGDVYGLVAGEIEKCAQWMVETLGKAVDKIVEAAATYYIPGAGWYKIIKAVEAAIEIFKEAKKMIEELEGVIENVELVIEIAEDPVDAGIGKLEEKLEPLTEKLEQVEKGADVAKDLADLSDTSVWSDEPDDGYSTGDDPERDG